jgi:hypothetical protein
VLCRWSGHASALIQLEGHGRETLFDDIDLTRSVGWFTSAYPLRLTPQAEQGARSRRSRSNCAACRTRASAMACCVTWRTTCRQSMAGLPSAASPSTTSASSTRASADALFHPLDEPAGLAHDPDAPLPNG